MTFQYGVFRLAQIWTVTDQESVRLGFPSREAAIYALATIVAVHRAAGQAVEVTIQDDSGGVRTLRNPREDELFEPVGEGPWDRLLGQPSAYRTFPGEEGAP